MTKNMSEKEQHTDTQPAGYDKGEIKMTDVICRFFIGEDPTPTDEWNSNCDHPVYGGNCDDPTRPCSDHYDEDVVIKDE